MSHGEAELRGASAISSGNNFSIDQVIHPRVKKMGAPEIRPEIEGKKMMISSPSEKARDHVSQGFALVYAQWDFEAYRHFYAALKEDPECLMAYCGLTLALSKPYNEYVKFRMAAVTRMQDLMEADEKAVKAGKLERFPLMEKKFAAATAALVSLSPRAAGMMFKELSEEFPKFLQARILSVFLTRGGYDVLGMPTPDQKKAIDKMRELLENEPDNPLLLSFWLALNGEAPNRAINIKKEILPYARYLVKKCPSIPSWQHALGHYEWRAGNYLLAQQAFIKAAKLYSEWMGKEGIDINDCEGYVRARCYLANTIYQRGNFTEAMEVAKGLRAIKLDPARPTSAGNHILLWRAYTLPARLYIAHGAEGDMDRALESLPDREELKPFAAHKSYPTLAGVYVEALSAYIGSRKAIEANMMADASKLHKKILRKHIMDMASVSEGARRSGDFSHYFNAGTSLAIFDMELAGLVAMNGPKDMRMIASNKFMSARDRQGVPSMMMPPSVFTPMENRLAEYYLEIGDNKAAYEAYQSGLSRYPNNMDSLLGLQQCLVLLGNASAADRVQKHIDLVRSK